MTHVIKALQRRQLLTGLAGGLLLAPAMSFAHAYRRGDLEIDHPTMTPSRGRTGVHAGYMTLINRGRAADRLVGAACARASRVELHTHIREGDMMRMRRVDGGVPVPAGQTVRFESGGLHLMIFGVTGTLVEGDTVPLTLRFERAGAVQIVAMVENRSSAAHSHSH